jgi:hypothetical protein
MGTWSGDDDGGGVKVIWSVYGGGGEDHANSRKQVEGQHEGGGNLKSATWLS